MRERRWEFTEAVFPVTGKSLSGSRGRSETQCKAHYVLKEPQGLMPVSYSTLAAARLKACPDTNQSSKRVFQKLFYASAFLWQSAHFTGAAFPRAFSVLWQVMHRPAVAAELWNAAGSPVFTGGVGRLGVAIGASLLRRLERLFRLCGVVADFTLAGDPRVGGMGKCDAAHCWPFQLHGRRWRLLAECNRVDQRQTRELQQPTPEGCGASLVSLVCENRNSNSRTVRILVPPAETFL